MKPAAPNLRVLFSNTHNPWFNLATEDWIFRQMAPDAQTLFLWRNQETVVIGRSQNPWGECNLKKMEDDKVLLARRTSGGGAVFHDLGNTCFTFLSPKAGYDRNVNISILLKTLAQFGIQAEASGRNDLVIPMDDGPRKVSGSAYRETRDRAFHHGTLLRHANLSRLADYLTPHPKKLASKGRTSVRSRVMNLGEVSSELNGEGSHERICSALIQAFFETHGSECPIETLDHSTLEKIETLKSTYEEFASWEWRFGNAPQFQLELTEYLSWGFFQIFIDSEKAHMKRVEVYSDALYPDVIQDIQTNLIDQPFSRAGVEKAVSQTRLQHPSLETELSEFEAWLSGQVEA